MESTIRAYGAGQIKLPELDPKTNKQHIRYAPRTSGEHPYSKQSVAQFLGWTKADGQPNHCCNVAFEMLDAFEAGIVTRKQLRGVKRDVAREIISNALRIKREQEKVAAEPKDSISVNFTELHPSGNANENILRRLPKLRTG